MTVTSSIFLFLEKPTEHNFNKLWAGIFTVPKFLLSDFHYNLATYARIGPSRNGAYIAHRQVSIPAFLYRLLGRCKSLRFRLRETYILESLLRDTMEGLWGETDPRADPILTLSSGTPFVPAARNVLVSCSRIWTCMPIQHADFRNALHFPHVFKYIFPTLHCHCNSILSIRRYILFFMWHCNFLRNTAGSPICGA